MNDSAKICSRLIVAGTLPRKSLPELDHPQIRAEVEKALANCGLSLASSAYSEHWGIQLSTDTADASVLDTPTNLGLGADACALLTVLWARLALQSRTAEDDRSAPSEQPSLLSEARAQDAREYRPSIRLQTLEGEFGKQLGGKTRLRGLLSQLRRLGFVFYRTYDDISAGPLMELGIDGERMTSFIRSRVLGELLGVSQNGVPETAPPLQEGELTLVSEEFDPSGTRLKKERPAADG
jgi:hypothetical protein